MSMLLRQLGRQTMAASRTYYNRGFVGRIVDDAIDNMERFERQIAHIRCRSHSPRYFDPFTFDSIVENNGIKKFKLEFDVRRFKPEEVNVITKNRELSIEAQKESDDMKARYNCTVTIPEGVDPKAITCKYVEGKLTIEAPYEPPAGEPPKET